jgi:enolase
LVNDYSLRFLEDPFSERDIEGWAYLARSQDKCLLIGDNFYSSDAVRIAEGAAKGLTHGVVVKPNQAGTVTAACNSIGVAKDCGQIVIASHRSISTESTLIATIACTLGADFIKVGPLHTDYSSVLRVNEMIRLAG